MEKASNWCCCPHRGGRLRLRRHPAIHTALDYIGKEEARRYRTFVILHIVLGWSGKRWLILLLNAAILRRNRSATIGLSRLRRRISHLLTGSTFCVTTDWRGKQVCIPDDDVRTELVRFADHTSVREGRECASEGVASYPLGSRVDCQI